MDKKMSSLLSDVEKSISYNRYKLPTGRNKQLQNNPSSLLKLLPGSSLKVDNNYSNSAGVKARNCEDPNNIASKKLWKKKSIIVEELPCSSWKVDDNNNVSEGLSNLNRVNRNTINTPTKKKFQNKSGLAEELPCSSSKVYGDDDDRGINGINVTSGGINDTLANKELLNTSMLIEELPSSSFEVNENNDNRETKPQHLLTDIFVAPSNSTENIPAEMEERFRDLVIEGTSIVNRIEELKVEFIPPPQTAEEVIEQNILLLTPYERMEAPQYKHIYFYGEHAKKRPGMINCHLNALYDDFNGFYRHVLHDHIAYRYETFNALGRGSFGEVVRAYDHKRQEFVAIKIIRNKPIYSLKAEKEIRLMQFLRRKDKNDTMNVLHLKNAFIFRLHTCLVLELMSENLYQLMRTYYERGLDMHMVRKLTISILKGLYGLGRNRVLHGDIKPENLLRRHSAKKLKLSDFGMSQFLSRGRLLTDPLIQTRWYRAPEVLLGLPYGMPIDMWSLGCVVVEMITGEPLFTGEDEIDQLALIIEVLDMPPQHILDRATRVQMFFHDTGVPRYYNATRCFNSSVVAGTSGRGKPRGYPGTRPLASIIDVDNPELLDFIERCITWDPNERLTPKAALKHAWIQKSIPKPPPTEASNPDTPVVSIRLRSAFQHVIDRENNSMRYSQREYSLIPFPESNLETRSEQLRVHTSDILSNTNLHYPPISSAHSV